MSGSGIEKVMDVCWAIVLVAGTSTLATLALALMVATWRHVIAP